MINKISGFSIPAYFNLPNVKKTIDHTYVMSDDGSRWGCFGRDEGGEEICNGHGLLQTATCLAEEDGKCGISYGVTGVCHQTANRILYSTGETKVDTAGGYKVSVFLFGHYGRLLHPQMSACFGESDHEEDIDMDEKGLARPTAKTGEEASRTRELQEITTDALGMPLEAEVFQALLEVQRNLWDEQASLKSKLEDNTITSQHYLSDLNFALKKSMLASADVLGPVRYKAIFGEAGNTPEDLIDASTFFEQEKKVGRL